MTDSVLVCVEDPTLARHSVAMVHEIGGFDTTPAETFREMRDALARHGAAVVLLHEDFGPLPLPDLLRELTADHPLSAPVVLAREPTAPFVRAAMEAGARAVVELPLALEDLELRMSAAATWSAALRRRLSTVDGEAVMPPQARMVAVAGAKGGVGTTTVAVQLALAAATAADHERRVCLVDLDLQTGDVPATLGIAPGRSIADLVEAADGLTQRSIEDSLFAHPSGLRVLLGPAEGEREEDVTEHLSREVLGGLRSRSGVVVVDCGAVTTEASAVAVEMADVVLLVATTDVPCLRAAKRLLRLWSRLEVCKPDEVLLVINRASRRDEVQPRLAGTVTGLRLARTTLPARFRKLEPVLNATPPERADQHPLWPAVLALGREIDLLPPPRRWRWLPRLPGWARGRDRRSDEARETGDVAESESGSGPVEALIAGGMALLLFLMLLQGILAVFTVVIAGRGANVGARQLGVGAPVEATVHEQLPSGWRRDAAIQIEGEAVRVTLSVPVLLGGGYGDGFLDWRITMRAGTTMEPS